jgi:cysteine-rich repeat protein
MRTSLRLSSRLVLAVLLFACSKQEGIRVLDASGGPGPDIAPPTFPDAGNDVSSAPDVGKDVSSAPDARADADAGDVVVQLCGNGILDPGEGCDDGNTLSDDGCSPHCQLEGGPDCPYQGCVATQICGNGILTASEICDDGNSVGGDGCSADCQAVEPGFRCRVPGRRCAPICGDRMLKDGETCDDGNTLDGDGCSVYCLTEPGWDCTSGTCVPAVDGGVDSGVLGPYCGDGVISAAEECDEGPANGDGVYGGCTSKCFFGPFCGDGMVNGPEEQCDLAELNGTVSGKDGCTIGCRTPHYCGDGYVDTDRGEECDLGDRNGVKLDSNMTPSTASDAMVYCTADCMIPCCVF